MVTRRSSDLEDKPHAAAWLKAHPVAAANLYRIIQCMNEHYAGDNQGFIDRNEQMAEYRFAPMEGESLFWTVEIKARQKLTTVRFYLFKANRSGKWQTRILKSATGGDLHAIDFKIGNKDTLDDLQEFIFSTETFSKTVQTGLREPFSIAASEKIKKFADEEPEFDPNNEEDGRDRIFREIVFRQGQTSFRNRLIEQYDCKCVITGCDVEQVLEAAHITPYLGEHTNLMQNGLLLRADIHVLWDRGLIAIDIERYVVWIADEIKATMYRGFAEKKLDKAVLEHAELALARHWKWVRHVNA